MRNLQYIFIAITIFLTDGMQAQQKSEKLEMRFGNKIYHYTVDDVIQVMHSAFPLQTHFILQNIAQNPAFEHWHDMIQNFNGYNQANAKLTPFRNRLNKNSTDLYYLIKRFINVFGPWLTQETDGTITLTPPTNLPADKLKKYKDGF